MLLKILGKYGPYGHVKPVVWTLRGTTKFWRGLSPARGLNPAGRHACVRSQPTRGLNPSGHRLGRQFFPRLTRGRSLHQHAQARGYPTQRGNISASRFRPGLRSVRSARRWTARGLSLARDQAFACPREASGRAGPGPSTRSPRRREDPALTSGGTGPGAGWHRSGPHLLIPWL